MMGMRGVLVIGLATASCTSRITRPLTSCAVFAISPATLSTAFPTPDASVVLVAWSPVLEGIVVNVGSAADAEEREEPEEELLLLLPDSGAGTAEIWFWM